MNMLKELLSLQNGTGDDIKEHSVNSENLWIKYTIQQTYACTGFQVLVGCINNTNTIIPLRGHYIRVSLQKYTIKMINDLIKFTIYKSNPILYILNLV